MMRVGRASRFRTGTGVVRTTPARQIIPARETQAGPVGDDGQLAARFMRLVVA